MKLIPPDLKRCQAEKPNGVNFMTLGGTFGYIRCDERPTYIATEIKKPHGQMSLCVHCSRVMMKQMPDVATLSRIT